MAYDIVTTMMDQILTIATLEMQTNIATTDPLRLKTVEKAPLQKDKTSKIVAPFIVVAFDVAEGRILDPVHDYEMGGGVKWLNFLSVVGRIPRETTKDAAYVSIAKFGQRFLRAMLKHWDLDGVVADDGETVFDSTIDIIERHRHRVIGGDNEWYGEFCTDLHFYSVETPEMRGL